MTGGPPRADRGLGKSVGRTMLAAVVAVVILAAGATWWQVVDAPSLTGSPDDAANVAAARSVVRGTIRDRAGRVLASTTRDANGEPYRVYASTADSAPVLKPASSVRPGAAQRASRRAWPARPVLIYPRRWN